MNSSLNFYDIKSQLLKQLQEDLYQDIRSAYAQLNIFTRELDKNRQRREIEILEAELKKVESQLASHLNIVRFLSPALPVLSTQESQGSLPSTNLKAQLLDDLRFNYYEDYRGAFEQLRGSLNQVQKNQLWRQIRAIEQEILQTEKELWCCFRDIGTPSPETGQILCNQYQVSGVSHVDTHYRVIKAWDRNLCRYVGIKTPHYTDSADNQLVQHLREELLYEGRVLSILDDPHIVRVYGLIEDPFGLVQEWIQGYRLADMDVLFSTLSQLLSTSPNDRPTAEQLENDLMNCLQALRERLV